MLTLLAKSLPSNKNNKENKKGNRKNRRNKIGDKNQASLLRGKPWVLIELPGHIGLCQY